jgi:hypothetical protein
VLAITRARTVLKQSAAEGIWSMPNGLQGYQLLAAWSQRRVDAFVQIVRDPRLQRGADDEALKNFTGVGSQEAITGHRLNNGSSCIGGQADGMNRANNDLRDWPDEGGARLPKGEYGVNGWVNDPAAVSRVRELYPPSRVMRVKIENDRRVFLNAMAQIKDAMVLGVDKKVYVEPTIWTIEWAQCYYNYPISRSN